VTRASLVGALALAIGCADDPGPLDPATIAELARTKGDAHGYGRTATYDAMLTPDSCDCPAIDFPIEMVGSLCVLQLVPEAFVTIQIVQNDGTLLLEFEPFELVGPIDQDGTFSLGAIDEISVFESGRRTARLDGSFEDIDLLVGEFAQHYDAKTLDQTFDCTERFSVEAIRRP
jgi:hypothetical protein